MFWHLRRDRSAKANDVLFSLIVCCIHSLLDLKIRKFFVILSQDDVADITGFSKSCISNVECAKHNLSLVNAVKFANVVNKTVDKMIKDL